MRQLHPFGQALVNSFVMPHLMADVCEIGMRNIQLYGQCYGLLQIEMGNMFLLAQGIDHQYFRSNYLFFFGCLNKVGICNVGEVTNPVSRYTHVQMPDLYGRQMKIPNRKWLIIDYMKIQLRNTRIFFFTERIIKIALHCICCLFIGEKMHRALAEKIVRPYIIQSGDMVFVGMGKNNCIKMIY